MITGNREILTSHEAAALLQVNPSSINNWIRSSGLKAYKTPGGHRRIQAASLVKFLIDCEMPVPRSLDELCARRVLWANPDGRTRKRLERRFEKLEPSTGTVRLCATGAEALLVCGEFEPHVVVLDSHISDIDRMLVVTTLLSHEKTAKTKVCLVDDNPTAAFKAKANADGVFDCLSRSDDPMRVLDL